jgi:uncharacterized membrane protein YdfJ with MMPL/SSD domain
MLSNLATFIHANGRRVLLVAVLGAALAGAFGFGVAKHMSPYGANDPATQSVQATNRFEAAAHRKIDPGIVAIVSAGDVHSPAARQRVEQVAGQLRPQPDVASAVSFYDTHDPSMVSRDGGSTYVVAYFKQRSDSQLQDAAQRIEDRFAGQRDVRLGGEQIADAQANTQVGSDLARAELLAFPLIFLLSLLFFRSLVAALLPPLLGGLAIVATFFALRIVSSFADLSVFALNFVTGLGLGLAIAYSLFMVSRYREEAATSGFGHETPRLIKELGLGTALAVLIDASIIRALLVPSLMELLGSWNWWAPRPLRRLHDRIGLLESRPRATPTPNPSRA